MTYFLLLPKTLGYHILSLIILIALIIIVFRMSAANSTVQPIVPEGPVQYFTGAVNNTSILLID